MHSDFVKKWFSFEKGKHTYINSGIQTYEQKGKYSKNDSILYVFHVKSQLQCHLAVNLFTSRIEDCCIMETASKE